MVLGQPEGHVFLTLCMTLRTYSTWFQIKTAYDSTQDLYVLVDVLIMVLKKSNVKCHNDLKNSLSVTPFASV